MQLVDALKERKKETNQQKFCETNRHFHLSCMVMNVKCLTCEQEQKTPVE